MDFVAGLLPKLNAKTVNRFLELLFIFSSKNKGLVSLWIYSIIIKLFLRMISMNLQSVKIIFFSGEANSIHYAHYSFQYKISEKCDLEVACTIRCEQGFRFFFKNPYHYWLELLVSLSHYKYVKKSTGDRSKDESPV